MDRGASWTAVHGVAKCQTGLTDFHLPKHKRCLRDQVTSRIKEKANWSHKTGRNQGRPALGIITKVSTGKVWLRHRWRWTLATTTGHGCC